jgi:hypothetical protein
MNITSWAGGNTTTNQSILNLRIQGAGGGSVDNTIIGQYHSSNTYGFAFNPFGVNVMNILGSGRVGIGTVNPQAILHIHESPVVGDVSRKEAIRGTRNGTGGIQNNVSMALSYGPNTIAVSPYGVIDFKVNGLPDENNSYGYIPNVTVMSVVGNGRVGIGTTDPATTLHVSGASSTYTNGQLFISDANYPGNQLRLFSYWGIQISTSFTTIQSMYDTTPNRLAINPNGGNVGIGTTNPAMPLSIGQYGGMLGGSTFTSAASVNGVSTGLTIPAGTMYLISCATVAGSGVSNQQWYNTSLVQYGSGNTSGFVTAISSSNIVILCSSTGVITVNIPAGNGTYTFTINAIRLC